MKRVYVNEKWCLGCRLCEFNCAFANSHKPDMALALKDKKIVPNIRIEEAGNISYAVSCRHCNDAICVKSCISGALYRENGTVKIDKRKCVGCHTCVAACPFGALTVSDGEVMQKCELCLENSSGSPACVKGYPNNAIVYEER